MTSHGIARNSDFGINMHGRKIKKISAKTHFPATKTADSRGPYRVDPRSAIKPPTDRPRSEPLFRPTDPDRVADFVTLPGRSFVPVNVLIIAIFLVFHDFVQISQ